MHEALSLAEHAMSQQEVPVGAVVVLEDKIIGKGWNQSIASNDPSAHAEIMALRDAAKTIENYRLVKTTLYVTLEPCLMCVGAILHARVKRLVFGAYDPKTGAAGTVFDVLSDARHNHSVEVQGGVLEKKSAEMLQQFFRQRR
ncbi:MAG: tRNA adenosine(34) deaminase TadA [Gammaproteobacteria bacterium]|nr:MAG: tRNA adenosine(34) deaminase TadA [Gammaproteobacteria bacterium]